MKKADFIKLVVKEINHIKTHATDGEKSKLNFESFEHGSMEDCIYGQMTGRCDSSRAKELYPKSFQDIEDGFTAGDFSSYIDQNLEKGTSYTPLEKFLYMSATKQGNKSKVHKEIIDHIKGETNTLNI